MVYRGGSWSPTALHSCLSSVCHQEKRLPSLSLTFILRTMGDLFTNLTFAGKSMKPSKQAGSTVHFRYKLVGEPSVSPSTLYLPITDKCIYVP